MQLVMEVLSQLEGAYALLIKSTHYPGELIACKRGSPMILGVRDVHVIDRQPSFNRLRDHTTDKEHWSGAMECWIASDASAVVEHTNR